jgi:hypothetical protein
MATATGQPREAKPRDARPFWRKHFFKLTLLPIGAAIAIWFLVIMPRTSKTVDEAFPTAAPARSAPTSAQPAATVVPAAAVGSVQAPPLGAAPPAARPTTGSAPIASAPTTNAPTAKPSVTVAPTSAPASSGPVAVNAGSFVKVEEDGSGKATIFKQGDGTFILRLENLDLTNGPDLRVRLLGANGTSIDLGGLKGNKGNQNYELPADFDPTKYDTADIWCRAFHVQFSKAALT